MIFALSNGVDDLGLMQKVKKFNASIARTCGDMQETWKSVRSNAGASIKFLSTVGPGFWPDPDVQMIGVLGGGANLNRTWHKTQLTEHEQYFQMTYWICYPAPIILGCDLEQLDDFTKGLLMNREVWQIHRDPLGNAGHFLYSNHSVFAKVLIDGSVAIGCLNWQDKDENIVIDFRDVSKYMKIDLSHGANVRNVWERKDEGLFHDRFATHVVAHSGQMYRLFPVR
jgi:alpha-galactosidase